MIHPLFYTISPSAQTLWLPTMQPPGAPSQHATAVPAYTHGIGHGGVIVHRVQSKESELAVGEDERARGLG